MKNPLNKLSAMAMLLVSTTALAQLSPPSDVSCRSQAKEIAAHTYSSCMGESRSTQLEQIKKDYQKQITDLKLRYEQELRKIGGKDVLQAPPKDLVTKAPATHRAAAKEVTSTDITAQARSAMKAKPRKALAARRSGGASSSGSGITGSTGSKPRATKGIARSLPSRKEVVSTPAPVSQVSEEQAVETSQIPPEMAADSETSPDLALPSSDDEAAQNDLQMSLNPATSAVGQ